MATDQTIRRCVGASAGVLVFLAAAITAPDPDLWGHVRFGLDMIATWRLPSIDPYSFTQDVPWINHEWLSELQMGAAYAAGGAVGLSFLKGTLLSAAAWLFWRHARTIDLAPRMIAAGLIVVALSPAAQTLRPHVWTILALALVCLTLVADDRRRRWLPLVFAVWANLHGGFLVGLGVVGAWTLGTVIASPRTWLRSGLLVVACALATLVTPYGFTLWRFLFETVELGRPHIEEWQPVWSQPTLLVVWITVTGTALRFIPRLGVHRSAVALVAVMLAFASFRVIRLVPLYAEVLALLLVPALAARFPLRPARTRPFDRAEQRTAFGLLGVAAATAVLAFPGQIACLPVDRAWTPPSPVVRQMLAGGPPGRLVSFFNWGEYALWHLSPRILVSMDGRRETVYSERRLAEHLAILEGRPDGLAALAGWQAEYVWLPADSRATRRWLLGQGYRVEWEDPDAYLAVRGNLPPLPRAAALGRRCFPE